MEHEPGRIVGLYQRHARAFDRDRARVLVERPWLDALLALVPPGGSVLDIGCGMGEPIAAYLLAQGRRVTGIDAAPAMIELCRERFPGADWRVADMRGLRLGRTFDGVIAWDSFFHLDRDAQRATIPVLAAHAAPGAPLLFTSGPREGVAMGVYEGEPLFHASLAPEEYRALLREAGFGVLDHRSEDPACGGRTIWLARRMG
ncbi:MAG TPA: methyltransferase domain-containing protein [Salinarimonas sp.]|nr:methyltransferase domain-containing protein [Salinarimonas sp.]